MMGRDLLLIAVSLTGIVGGVALPETAAIFSPYILQYMMMILFLSFLRLNFSALLGLGGGPLFEVAVWSAWKLLVMPVILWGVCRLVLPGYSLAVLLLAGVSAGVTAPFFASLLGGNVERVLQVVVVTSLLVPLTLPSLAQLLMGAELAIPYWPMVRLLLLVIFVPLAASIAMRRLFPTAMPYLARVQFPLLLSLFLSINLGVFATYAGFLRAHLGEVAVILLVCCIGALVFAGSGFLLGRLSGGRLNGLDGAVLMTYVNNVLIVVFAARFFGPTEPLMAAAYLLPLNVMLLPIRFVVQRETKYR
jgi:bile acid:Na+ symporter, BASS family